jgi:hypothetical protein
MDKNQERPEISAADARIIAQVAQQYKLDEERKRLLYAIRMAENGRQGREFGVLNDQAMRYENDPDPSRSFRLQAEWAAGTIQKRYTGDLNAFAKRWAPLKAKNDPKNLNANWPGNVSYYMNDAELNQKIQESQAWLDNYEKTKVRKK